MNQQRYTQTDMEEFDRIALERKKYAAILEEDKHHCRDQYMVVQPKQGGGINNVRNKEHPEYLQLVQ